MKKCIAFIVFLFTGLLANEIDLGNSKQVKEATNTISMGLSKMNLGQACSDTKTMNCSVAFNLLKNNSFLENLPTENEYLSLPGNTIVTRSKKHPNVIYLQNKSEYLLKTNKDIISFDLDHLTFRVNGSDSNFNQSSSIPSKHLEMLCNFSTLEILHKPQLLKKEYRKSYEPATQVAGLDSYLEEGSGKPYSQFKQNRESVTIFHSKLTPQKLAMEVMLEREPVNIETSKGGCSNPEKISRMNTFSQNPQEAPYPVGVYSRSMMTKTFGDPASNINVGTLHVPALAFDHPEQIHYKKYLGQHKGKELSEKSLQEIKNEYEVIAKMVISGYLNHASIKSAPNNGRLLIGAYGANNFVKLLSDKDKNRVRKIIAETLVDELCKKATPLKEAGAKDVRLDILLTTKFIFESKSELQKRLNSCGLKSLGNSMGRIPDDSLNGDFNVNAWDPNSNVGNGNSQDNSLDGYHGRSSTAAYDIHTSPNLYNPKYYKFIDSF